MNLNHGGLDETIKVEMENGTTRCINASVVAQEGDSYVFSTVCRDGQHVVAIIPMEAVNMIFPTHALPEDVLDLFKKSVEEAGTSVNGKMPAFATLADMSADYEAAQKARLNAINSRRSYLAEKNIAELAASAKMHDITVEGRNIGEVIEDILRAEYPDVFPGVKTSAVRREELEHASSFVLGNLLRRHNLEVKTEGMGLQAARSAMIVAIMNAEYPDEVEEYVKVETDDEPVFKDRDARQRNLLTYTRQQIDNVLDHYGLEKTGIMAVDIESILFREWPEEYEKVDDAEKPSDEVDDAKGKDANATGADNDIDLPLTIPPLGKDYKQDAGVVADDQPSKFFEAKHDLGTRDVVVPVTDTSTSTPDAGYSNSTD